MIIIAIGANLPAPSGLQPYQTCQLAASALQDVLHRFQPVLSQWYETAPVPPSGQPPYINGVIGFEGEADPAMLLRTLQELEARFGRQRSVPNAARTLDLDIVAIGSLVRHTPDPALPHPRMHERAFVLRPMVDVAPAWRHPSLHLTAAALLARLPKAEQREVRPVCTTHLRDGGVPPI